MSRSPDRVAHSQRFQTVLLSGLQSPRQLQCVQDFAVLGNIFCAFKTFQFVIDEGDVEHCVMDDQLRILDDLQKLRCHIVKTRLS